MLGPGHRPPPAPGPGGRGRRPGCRSRSAGCGWNCAAPWTTPGPAGPGWSRRPPRSGGGWSGTCTTAPSRGSSRSGCGCAPSSGCTARRPDAPGAGRRGGRAGGGWWASCGAWPTASGRAGSTTGSTRPSATWSAAARSRWWSPWTRVEVSDAVATTAYFVVAECLANTLKHADAGSARITISQGEPAAGPDQRRRRRRRAVRVRAERAAGPGGRARRHASEIDSPPGAGTTIVAELLSVVLAEDSVLFREGLARLLDRGRAPGRRGGR